MNSQDINYRHHLPHIHPEGYRIFITFNLAGSLPKDVVEKLKEKRSHEKYFERYDEWLDNCEHGHQWLKDERIASSVTQKIHSFENGKYELFTYCIMPNHVHLLVKPIGEVVIKHQGTTAAYALTDTLRLIKGSTARDCNIILKRTGSFWQHESYDHYVRDKQELERIIKYILNNPVKAGLVKEWVEWKFAYINPILGSW